MLPEFSYPAVIIAHCDSMKKALVIGATGLVGSQLVKRLLRDERFGEVEAFLRRSTGLSDPGLKEHLVDFDRPEQWQHLIKGDALFSALGTTRKKAGGKQEQWKVDYHYQFQFAAAAARNAVLVLVLVSSVGADPHSRFFYARMKGRLEQDVKSLLFRRLVIIRPGPLSGQREEPRPMEKAGLALMDLLNRAGLMRKYRPIAGEMVARAMINACFDERTGVIVYSAGELFPLAESGGVLPGD